MIARWVCWLFGHDPRPLWVGEDLGGLYCPRCNSCGILPPPRWRP